MLHPWKSWNASVKHSCIALHIYISRFIPCKGRTEYVTTVSTIISYCSSLEVELLQIQIRAICVSFWTHEYIWREEACTATQTSSPAVVKVAGLKISTILYGAGSLWTANDPYNELARAARTVNPDASARLRMRITSARNRGIVDCELR